MTIDGLMITVLTTGGTIDKVYSLAGHLETGPPAVRDILRVAGTDLQVRVEEVLAKDSRELDDADRDLIGRRVRDCTSERVLITHGTDTMTDTAQSLGSGGGKTVVLTGAMQPASMRDSDAALNVGAALAALQCLAPGVYVCMSGRVFSAGTVEKDHARGRFVERVGPAP